MISFSLYDTITLYILWYNWISEKYEDDLFQAEMGHIDTNSNRTWTLRVGRGGNIYRWDTIIYHTRDMAVSKKYNWLLPPPFYLKVYEELTVNQSHLR